MAREIIIYSQEKQPSGDTDLKFVFWLSVPLNLQAQFTRSTASSILPLSTAQSWGVTPTELTALQNGSVIEQVFDTQIPASETAAQVATLLQTSYTSAQTALNNLSPAKSYVGAYYDSVTGWQNVPA